MELLLREGDYVADGQGGVVRLEGEEALLARVLFRLTARRGMLPMLPELGSRLYLLGREGAEGRLSAARQYVAEALAEEDVTVESVELEQGTAGTALLRAFLSQGDTTVTAEVTISM